MINRWPVLAVLFLARTAMGFQFQSVASLSSFVVTELGINFTQLGLLIGFYLLPGVVIAYPSGLLSQRFGDKRIAILGMTLMVVGGGLTAFGHSYAIFLVGRVISGAGAVLLNVVLTKMVTDWFVGRELGTALALLVSSWPVGIGAALIILPPLAGAASAEVALALTAAIASIVLVLMVGIYRAPISSENVSPPKARLGFAISQREFGLVSLTGVVWALFNVGYIVLISFGPSLLMAQGIPVKAAGVATSLASWTVIPTIALGGMLVDRLGHATSLMVISLATLALSIMLMPSSSSFALIAFIGAVGGLPCGAMLMLPTEVLSCESRSPGMGIFYTWYYVGMALLTPLAGLVRDFTGNAGAPLTFAGFLEIGAIAVLLLLRSLEHHDRLPA
ncbi:MAG TPA: MFS transporter [Xanthobacteraceae bacterium]